MIFCSHGYPQQKVRKSQVVIRYLEGWSLYSVRLIAPPPDHEGFKNALLFFVSKLAFEMKNSEKTFSFTNINSISGLKHFYFFHNKYFSCTYTYNILFLPLNYNKPCKEKRIRSVVRNGNLIHEWALMSKKSWYFFIATQCLIMDKISGKYSIF